MGARAILIALIVTVGSGAAYADEPMTLKHFERWVGSWSGKASGKGCGADVPKKVTLEVAWSGSGTLRSNGDVFVEGFGDLDWVPTRKGLSASREGLTATLTGKTSATFTLKTDGGCKIKATLKRATSKIAACDKARAYAAVKAQCGVGPDDLAAIDAEWKSWGKLTGKKKKAQAAACTEKATLLESEIGSCAAGTVVAGSSTGAAECDELIDIMRCMARSVPEALKAVEDSVQAWRDALNNQASRQITIDACRQSLGQMREAAKSVGC